MPASIPKLLSKFNNRHFFSLAGNVVMSVLAVVTTALLYHYLPGKEESGKWVFFLTVFTLFEMARAGFLTTATVKYYSGADANRASEVIGSAWLIGAIITAVLITVSVPALFVVKALDNPGLVFFFTWFAPTYVLTLPAVITNCALQAEGRFDRLLYMRMVNQFSFIALIIYFSVTGQLTLLKVMYSYLTAQLVTTIYLLARGWSYVSALKKRTKKTLYEIYHYGKYTVAGNISANLLRGSDIFIIEFMFPGKPGLELIGVYNVGLRLMEVVEIPLRSFVATAMPAISAAYNQEKKGYVIYLMKKYAGFVTFVLIPICLGSVLLADVAVYIIGGKKYMGTEAANVLRLFMTFALLFPTDRFFAVTLDAIHKPNINVLKILAMLATNIITDFAGIRIFGNIYGVALATIFPTLVGIGVGYWALNKYQPFSILNIYKVGYEEVKALIYKVLKKPLPQSAENNYL